MKPKTKLLQISKIPSVLDDPKICLKCELERIAVSTNVSLSNIEYIEVSIEEKRELKSSFIELKIVSDKLKGCSIFVS